MKIFLFTQFEKGTKIQYSNGDLNLYSDKDADSIKANVGDSNDVKLSTKNFEAESTTVSINCDNNVNNVTINSHSDISSLL